MDFDAPLPILTSVSLRSDQLTSPTGRSFLVAATATAASLSTAKKVGKQTPPSCVFLVPQKERKKSQEVVENKILDPLIFFAISKTSNFFKKNSGDFSPRSVVVVFCFQQLKKITRSLTREELENHKKNSSFGFVVVLEKDEVFWQGEDARDRKRRRRRNARRLLLV